MHPVLNIYQKRQPVRVGSLHFVCCGKGKTWFDYRTGRKMIVRWSWMRLNKRERTERWVSGRKKREKASVGFSDLGGTLVKNNEVLCKKDDDFGLEMI